MMVILSDGVRVAMHDWRKEMMVVSEATRRAMSVGVDVGARDCMWVGRAVVGLEVVEVAVVSDGWVVVLVVSGSIGRDMAVIAERKIRISRVSCKDVRTSRAEELDY